MYQHATKSLIPPLSLNLAGDPRRVGVEIEFSGLELGRIIKIVQEELGGEVTRTSRYEARVDSEYGPVRVEFDARVFREMKVRNFFQGVDPELLSEADRESLEAALATIAA